ncbi:MAG: hypothetical protein IT459_20640 [Planctomycetes bacterium]|nr:hypothetical protein [Planctomycetota bacterium]
MVEGQASSMGPEVDAGAQVKRLLAAAGRNRLRILLLGLFGLAMGALIATFVPDLYESRTLLLLRQRELIDDSRLLRAISEKPLIQKEQTLENELLSFQWIHDVLRECEWLEYARIKDDPKEISDLIHKIQEKQYFQVAMSTDPAGELLVELKFRWDDPIKARDFVKKARKNWINRRDDEHRRYWRKQRDDFEKILQERLLAYQSANNSLQKFESQNRLPLLTDANEQIALKTALLQSRSLARSNVEALTGKVTSIETSLGAVPKTLQTSSTEIENPEFQQALGAVAAEQAEYDTLIKSGKSPKHVKVKQQKSRLEEAQKKLVALKDKRFSTSEKTVNINPAWYEQRKTLDEASAELEAERKRLLDVEQQLVDIQRELDTLPSLIAQRRQLQNDVDQAQVQLNEATNAIQPVRDTVEFIERRSALTLGNAEDALEKAGAYSVLEEPVEAKKPTGLPKPVFGLIGLLLGVGIGLAFALVSEMMRTSFSGPDEVAQALRLPVLGAIDSIRTSAEVRREKLVAMAQVVGAVLVIVSIGAFVWLLAEHPERLPPGFRKAVDDVRASFK